MSFNGATDYILLPPRKSNQPLGVLLNVVNSFGTVSAEPLTLEFLPINNTNAIPV